MYIHTCIHTYIHTSYIHTYIHTYIHPYIHASIHTYIHTYKSRARHHRSLKLSSTLKYLSIFSNITRKNKFEKLIKIFKFEEYVNASSKSKNKAINHNPGLYWLHITFQKYFHGNSHAKHTLRAVAQRTYP